MAAVKEFYSFKKAGSFAFILNNMEKEKFDRRKFMKRGGMLLGSVAASGMILPQHILSQDLKDEGVQEISPVEDLMREHGILSRILLVYEEGVNRIMSGKTTDPAVFHEAAKVIGEFVEDYHEMQEEKFLFPRFLKANSHVDLVRTLQRQHGAGRLLTGRILDLTDNPSDWDREKQLELSRHLLAHMRMYRAHEAWEDTLLFPAFKKLVSGNEYEALAEDFEKEEVKAFGEGGFERFVEKTAELEKQLGIHDLDRYTPVIE